MLVFCLISAVVLAVVNVLAVLYGISILKSLTSNLLFLLEFFVIWSAFRIYVTSPSYKHKVFAGVMLVWVILPYLFFVIVLIFNLNIDSIIAAIKSNSKMMQLNYLSIYVTIVLELWAAKILYTLNK